MTNKIDIIELHISNICNYRCKICAKDYGGINKPFADWNYINKIIENLIRKDDKRIECDMLQTGGCGEAALNPEYINYLREIKFRLPDQKICLYTNFSLWNGKKVEYIIKEKLLNQIQVRIDSFISKLYNYSTTGNIEKVKENIENFMKINDNIEFTLIYFPLYKYTQAVENKLGKKPAYFNEDTVKHLLKDEWQEICKWYDDCISRIYIYPHLYKKRISGICYWAERKDCKPETKGNCRHLPENEGTFDKICQIYPNGDVGLCAYDSLQNTFIYGNIFNQPLFDIWDSQEKYEMIDGIRQERYYGQGCCINPKACEFECV